MSQFENLTPDETQRMKSVFLLWHINPETDDVKLIGAYASESDAAAAISRVQGAPGFKSTPDGFDISEYEIGKDHWTEGFVISN